MYIIIALFRENLELFLKKLVVSAVRAATHVSSSNSLKEVCGL